MTLHHQVNEGPQGAACNQETCKQREYRVKEATPKLLTSRLYDQCGKFRVYLSELRQLTRMKNKRHLLGSLRLRAFSHFASGCKSSKACCTRSSCSERLAYIFVLCAPCLFASAAARLTASNCVGERESINSVGAPGQRSLANRPAPVTPSKKASIRLIERS